ncbi:MAG: YihA family ribosome biogenesis GTP-binding protein [Spirochaetales bacterium]|nr:MAG: YihA family ribosome biogenesis GTP-binding protein [Spirochaetales bacterium]
MRQARFISSSPHYRSLPVSAGKEVAFAGRSNAGKSSVLNTITGRRALAKISSSPGKTRHINLFGLDEQAVLRLADLPGYGYAKVNVREQKRWGEELTRYVMERESLCGVVIVVDIRRSLTENDRQMLTLCRTAGRPVHVLLNKSDKLKKSMLFRTVRDMEKELAFLAPGASMSSFSALKKTGLPEFYEVLGRWLQLL